MSLTNTQKDNYLLSLCLQLLGDKNLEDWLTSKHDQIDSARTFFLNFGLIARKIPRVPVVLSSEQMQFFISANPGFQEQVWTKDDLCRLSLLTSIDPAVNKEYISTLLSAADMREQVVIYRSLPFFVNPEDFIALAIDGIRTNMVDVFDSIALDNNFPFLHFPENAWNQMVLKAIFMERPIYRIYGLDKRRNMELAEILHDFVHERWAAKRKVTPELWRLIVGFINPEIFEDLKKVVYDGNSLEREAALKALEETVYQPAQQWLVEENLPGSTMSWEEIGKSIIGGK